jgi:hypothetical protein
MSYDTKMIPKMAEHVSEVGNGLVLEPAQERLFPDHVRMIHGATRLAALPLCVLFSHRWVAMPWDRWAFGWDREATCSRCGVLRHERARSA